MVRCVWTEMCVKRQLIAMRSSGMGGRREGNVSVAALRQASVTCTAWLIGGECLCLCRDVNKQQLNATLWRRAWDDNVLVPGLGC
jgi:hypothetical protein